MNWNIEWIILGAISFTLAGLHVFMAFLGKKRGLSFLCLFSMAFGGFTIWEELNVFSEWLQFGEAVALEKAVQFVPDTLLTGFFILVALNGLAIFLSKRRI